MSKEITEAKSQNHRGRATTSELVVPVPVGHVTTLRGTYSVALSTNQDGEYKAQCLEMREAVRKGRTEQEAIQRMAETIAMILERRIDDAKSDGKILIEMDMEVSPLVESDLDSARP